MGNKWWRVWKKDQLEEEGVEVEAETAFNVNKEAGPQLGNPPFSGVECQELTTPPSQALEPRAKRKASAKKRHGRAGQKRKQSK